MPKPINNDIPVAVLREALVLDPTAASGVRWRSRAGLSLQLAEQFLRLSGELDATRDAMRRLLLNGAEEPPKTPSTMPGQSRAGASIRTRERRKRPRRRSWSFSSTNQGRRRGRLRRRRVRRL